MHSTTFGKYGPIGAMGVGGTCGLPQMYARTLHSSQPILEFSCFYLPPHNKVGGVGGMVIML